MRRRKPTFWTPERTELLIQMINERRSSGEAGVVLGCSRDACVSKTKGMPYKFNSVRKSSRRKLSTQKVTEIIHLLHTSRIHQKDIAKTYNTTHHTISGIAHGIFYKEVPRPPTTVRTLRKYNRDL